MNANALQGLIIASALAVASAAVADDGANRKARVDQLDTNKDGLISRDEAAKAPRLSKAFDAIDSNKDGKLSREELAAFRRAQQKDGKQAPAQPGA